MKELPTPLLGQACRTFLALAYPEGEGSIPAPKKSFGHIAPDQALDTVLVAPICQTLHTDTGQCRGYALRLGSIAYPHLKLQVVWHEKSASWVFAVDTHDNLQLDPGHPDADRLARLQAANGRLKEQIERAWEAEDLTTFNALLRRELNRK
jgi:hypothetical protein